MLLFLQKVAVKGDLKAKLSIVAHVSIYPSFDHARKACLISAEFFGENKRCLRVFVPVSHSTKSVPHNIRVSMGKKN